MSELKLQSSRLDCRYDIIECLGRGSYSEVYLARDAAAGGGDDNQVVIKALNVYLQGTPDADLERTLVENFRNEAVALDRVRHPNIINRLGHGTARDLSGATFHYLVLEYMPGGDMAALCRAHPLAIERAMFYLEQICSGLTYAHKQGVIHRDIKPQNLLLSADRQVVKIADFGVARFAADEGAITRVGTDIYAAPEHHPNIHTGNLSRATLASSAAAANDSGSFARQRAPQLTPAADIYSLAKTAYMLLTGESPRRFSLKPINDLPAPFAEREYADDILRVLRRATEDDPRARYQTVEAFWNDLRDATLPRTKVFGGDLSERVDASSDKADESSLDESSSNSSSLENENVTPAPQHECSSSDESSSAPSVYDSPEEEFATRELKMPAAPAPPRFESTFEPREANRARIVVPFNAAEAERIKEEARQARRRPTVANRKTLTPAQRRVRSFAVGALLIALFVGMLFVAARYAINLRQHASANANKTANANNVNNPPNVVPKDVGHEFITTTNVNLRNAPSASADKIGVAEINSRVRVLRVNNNWCEISIIQHGQSNSSSDPQLTANQGWINSRYLAAK